jgi:chemotaxis response regulator CheB
MPDPDLHVVGEAGDGAEAVAIARTQRPDVVVMDVRMPVMDGITATRHITDAHLPCRVLILTTFDEDKLVTHRSVRELTASIRTWIADWNDNPRPFVWRETADEILDNLAQYSQRISSSRHSSVAGESSD